MPTEAQMLPRPVTPFCFAPHGTASIFSSIALSGCFFFPSPALPGIAANRTSDETRRVLILMVPPCQLLGIFCSATEPLTPSAEPADNPVAKQSKLRGE